MMSIWGVVQSAKSCICQSLESGGRVGQPLGHAVELEESFSGDKASFIGRLGTHRHVKKSSKQVKRTKKLVVSIEGVEAAIYAGEGVSILDGYLVERAIVDCKSQSAICLFHNDQVGCPG